MILEKYKNIIIKMYRQQLNQIRIDFKLILLWINFIYLINFIDINIKHKKHKIYKT